ncbi:MFS transporter, partial [Candidatus Bathyarchaeota archaeon]|nr:MFS transporter [Candidatus Bathyarchaeota archaeon]
TAGGIFGGLYGYLVQLYLKAIGFDSRAIGLLAMANILCCMILSIPFGLLGDRFGRRNSMLLGCVSIFASVMLLLAFREFPFLLVSFILLGVGNSSFNVLLQPLYASHFEGEEMDKAFGVMGFVSLASNALGSLLGYIPPALMSFQGLSLAEAYWATIAWSSLSLYIALAALLMVRPDKPTGRSFNRGLESKGILYRFSLLNILIGLAAGMFIELATYFLSVKFKVESPSIGMLYFSTSISGALANMAVPQVSRRLGTSGGITAGLILVLPLHLSVAVAPTFPIAAASYIARTSVMNITMTLLSSLMMRMTVDRERAKVNSFISLVSMASRGLGTAFGGTLM